MALVRIESGELRLEVVPEAGASIASLAARIAGDWVPILRPTPADAIASGNSSLFSSFALVPYSNRLRDARFDFASRSYQLRPNTAGGHAIHGDVRKRPWRIAANGPSRVSFAFDSRDFADLNFPFPFRCELDYALDRQVFTTQVRLRNDGPEPMPAGFGFHPYYRRSLREPADEVELQMAVGGVYRDLIPSSAAVPIAPEQDFRRPRPFGDLTFDHCFAGWDGRARIRWPKSAVTAEIEASEPFRHVVLFVPPGESFFALEPVSNANNGFNLLAAGVPDSGVRVLEPGETLAGRVTLRLTA